MTKLPRAETLLENIFRKPLATQAPYLKTPFAVLIRFKAA